MSKVNIRFVYRNQQEQEIKPVKSIHRGPINLSNLYETYVNPSYHEIDMSELNNQAEQKNQVQTESLRRQIKATSSVQVISKPTSPKTSHKLLKESQNAAVQPHFSAQLKTKKTKQMENSKPTINIEEEYESQLILKQQKKKFFPKSSQLQIPGAQIVLKSPSFKYIPKQEGQTNPCNRKEYIRAQKAQKYLYNGIPQKSQDDFVGCFGCFETKPRTFNVSNK